MLEMQMQPLDLSCPGKRLLDAAVCVKEEEAEAATEARRLSRGSDEVYSERSPSRSPSSSPAPPDQDTPSLAGPARKRFLSKFFRDPKGKNGVPSSLSNLIQNENVPVRAD